MWVFLRTVLDWVVEHKTLCAIIGLIALVVGTVVYIGYLKQELLEKESQISVLNSRLSDQEVLQNINELLGQNKVWQKSIDTELASIKEIDNYIHELSIEQSDGMAKILKFSKFPSHSSDAPLDPSVYDICESPCYCECSGGIQ